jgi:hypothetical protein
MNDVLHHALEGVEVAISILATSKLIHEIWELLHHCWKLLLRWRR